MEGASAPAPAPSASDATTEVTETPSEQPDAADADEAYSDGWNAECDDLWSASPDGNLYEDGVAHAVDECTAGLDPGNVDVSSDDAQAAGARDACTYSFETVSASGTLNWGTTHMGESSCPS